MTRFFTLGSTLVVIALTLVGCEQKPSAAPLVRGVDNSEDLTTYDGRGKTKCSFEIGSSPPVCMPSFVRIVSSPEQYHLMRISVKGVLVTGLDGRKVLFRDKQSAKLGDFREGILMPTDLDFIDSYQPLKTQIEKDQYCRVSILGDFDMSQRSMINSTGAFSEIYSMTLINCEPAKVGEDVHGYLSKHLEGF